MTITIQLQVDPNAPAAQELVSRAIQRTAKEIERRFAFGLTNGSLPIHDDHRRVIGNLDVKD